MMKDKVFASLAALVSLLILLSAISGLYSGSSNISTSTPANNALKVKPVCDGVAVTSNCNVDGINYITYVYHPAVPEKSHPEQVVSYIEKITGYCTACNDGTYSPSCATGRGACSWHGGVAEWNAPIYSRVPVYSTKTVVDTPAQEAYYEKVAE